MTIDAIWRPLADRTSTLAGDPHLTVQPIPLSTSNSQAPELDTLLLMDAKPGTPKGDELDVLVDLIEHYESKHVPMGYPDPLSAIAFRIEQATPTQRDRSDS